MHNRVFLALVTWISFPIPLSAQAIGEAIASGRSPPCSVGVVTANSVYVRYYVESSAFDFLLKGDCITKMHHQRATYTCVTATTQFGQTLTGWVGSAYINRLRPPDATLCPIEHLLVANGHDWRPKQTPCTVSDPAGLDWRLGPSADAPLRTEAPPNHFANGHVFGWESRPGPAFAPRAAVNGYIWVVRNYSATKAPTARAWVPLASLSCN
jgi:hypothetical protein